MAAKNAPESPDVVVLKVTKTSKSLMENYAKGSVTISFGVVGALAALALYVTILAGGISVDKALIKISYYNMLCLFGICSYIFVRNLTSLKPHRADLIRLSVGFSCSIILASIVFANISPTFRVLSDETNLIAISKSMYFDKSIVNSIMGRWFYNEYHSIKDVIPKRPLLFPFLVHLIHCIRGYDYHNAYILNFLALTVLLWLVFIVASRWRDWQTGIALQLCAIAPPSRHANSFKCRL